MNQKRDTYDDSSNLHTTLESDLTKPSTMNQYPVASLISTFAAHASVQLLRWMHVAGSLVASSEIVGKMFQLVGSSYPETFAPPSGGITHLMKSLSHVLPTVLQVGCWILIIWMVSVVGAAVVTGCVHTTRFTFRRVMRILCVCGSAFLELVSCGFLMVETAARIARGCVELVLDVLIN